MEPAREPQTTKQAAAAEPRSSAIKNVLEIPSTVSPTMRSVLRLQRVAGNAATRRFIQRTSENQSRLRRAPDAGTPAPPAPAADAGAPPPPLSLDIVQVISGPGTIILSGRVTASALPAGPGETQKVRLDGPEVRVPDTELSLVESVTLGNGVSIQVGYTQSVVSYERIALYQPAGGGSAIEVHTELGAARDAA